MEDTDGPLPRTTLADTNQPSAPHYHFPQTEAFAVEHPMIIRNLDNALKTFGTNRPFRRILDSDDPEECLPLYLRPNDPMCNPLLSQNVATNNVLLQITLPQRTGRKRKRGSQDSYTNSNESTLQNDSASESSGEQRSRFRLRVDSPVELLRSLKDNASRYRIETVAQVHHTHRFRGLSDFQQATSYGEFVPKLKDTVLTGEVAKMRAFKFDTRMGFQKNEEILPPPSFTSHALPFNWAWHQNPNIYAEVDAATGGKVLVNHSKPAEVHAQYVSHNTKTLPAGPSAAVPNEPTLLALVQVLHEAFEERPIWTRRGLANRIGSAPFYYLLRHGLQYLGYQFKGGPFRDAIIKYGVDPRTDPRYRAYQTIFFKLFEDEGKTPGMPWQDLRPGYNLSQVSGESISLQTHIFDGKNLTLDGKVWQMCDIHDPLLAGLIQNAPYPETFERNSDGWFTNGSLAKIRSIMKVKLLAIRTGKEVSDQQFQVALSFPDVVPGEKISRNIHIPVPDLRLTEEQVQNLKDRGVVGANLTSGMVKKAKRGYGKRARLNKGQTAIKKDHLQKDQLGNPAAPALPSESKDDDGGPAQAKNRLNPRMRSHPQVHESETTMFPATVDPDNRGNRIEQSQEFDAGEYDKHAGLENDDEYIGTLNRPSDDELDTEGTDEIDY